MDERLCPRCRKTLLSRYSRDPACAPCARASRGARPAAPAWLWDSAPVREALASADMAAFLTSIRAAMGLSQLELASLAGWSQSTVNRIESGERNTLYDIRELLRFTDTIAMPRHALIPLLTGNLVADPPQEGINPDMDMNRRHFTGVLAGSLVAGMGWGPLHVPDRVDIAHIKHLRATTQRLYADDQRIGGGLLLAPALHQVTRVRRMLDEADFSESIGRRLLSTAGELCVCAGWLAYDSGDQNLARQLYGEAHMYAEYSGDEQLRVNVASYLAMQAIRQARTSPGRAREALHAVTAGKEAARTWATPRVYALLAVREATAHAVMGDEIACRKAISTAWREIDRGAHQDDPDWAGFVTENTLIYFEGLTAMALAKPVIAADRFRILLAEPSIGERNRTYYRSCLANALLISGAKSDALSEGLQLLPLVSGSRRTLQELMPLREAAGESSEFGQRYDELLAA
ncbi:XRE family transcriptional regulator [Sphaerisporangium album]|uniref:XRE family transcriptional regulator n=1 Tax=Sphaerisporangium album TaxID=509200 RepID=A0A367FJ13_9ACTN|nr:helix-turn-helix transcriptional regulator [Sphaerisporangium album]RCG29620.1 XRE family transcriptional regulator [Sphaerisporangium album]